MRGMVADVVASIAFGFAIYGTDGGQLLRGAGLTRMQMMDDTAMLAC